MRKKVVTQKTPKCKTNVAVRKKGCNVKKFNAKMRNKPRYAQ